MTKTYRDWSADQAYLLPPSPQDWLPQGDLVYFLLDTVATLDLAPIFAHYERELRGQPPFHPRMMVALLLYCYATGTRSSRKIMRRCHVDVACRVIVGHDIPDFRTISDFRKIHLARLEALFVEVLKLCALAGLAKVGTIAIDGTKVKANASRHKAMSYDRMKTEEARLKAEIAKLLADAQATDDGRGPSSMARTVTATSYPKNWPAARAVWPRSSPPRSCSRNGPGPKPRRRRLAGKPRGSHRRRPRRARRCPSPRTRSTSPTPSRGS